MASLDGSMAPLKVAACAVAGAAAVLVVQRLMRKHAQEHASTGETRTVTQKVSVILPGRLAANYTALTQRIVATASASASPRPCRNRVAPSKLHS